MRCGERTPVSRTSSATGVRTPNADGTFRTTYLLNWEGSRLRNDSGYPIYYRITDNTGGPENFVLNASMMDGKSNAVSTKAIDGAELHISTAAGLGQSHANGCVDSAGSALWRAPLPALHKV